MNATTPPRRRDNGMVTAETAVVLPALLLVLALAISAVGHVLDVVRVTDAARAAARSAARGDDDRTVQAIARDELAPGVAYVTVVHASGTVTVTVSQPGDPLLPGVSGIGLRWPTVASESTALVEP